MLGWFKLQLFRTLKRSFAAIPSSVLRWRPFAVYQILIEDAPAAEPPDDSLCIRWGNDQDFDRLTSLTALSNRDRWCPIDYRFAIAVRHDQPVGVVWVANRCFHEVELGIEFELAENEAWIFAAHTASDFRRQGVYGALLRFVLSELCQEGTKRLLFGIAWGNTASVRAHEKFNCRAVGHLVAARILNSWTVATSRGWVKRKISVGGEPIRFHVMNQVEWKP